MKRASTFLLVTLGLVLAAYSLEAFHYLIVPHHYCSRHGEMSHHEAHTSAQVDEDEIAMPEKDSHAHCPISLFTRRNSLKSPVQIVLADDLRLSGARFFHFPTLAISPISVLQLSPSNSPPSVA